MATPATNASGAPSLPLILARELAANLATPMFLIDARGRLVFYNDAAERIIGKPFAEIGEIDGLDVAVMMRLCELDGTPIRHGESPAGIALLQRRPVHKVVRGRGLDGVDHTLEETAYPLFGRTEELHGVVAVFWETAAAEPEPR